MGPLAKRSLISSILFFEAGSLEAVLAINVAEVCYGRENKFFFNNYYKFVIFSILTNLTGDFCKCLNILYKFFLYFEIFFFLFYSYEIDKNEKYKRLREKQ